MTVQRPWGVFYRKRPKGRWQHKSTHRTMKLAEAAGKKLLNERDDLQILVRQSSGNVRQPWGRVR